jgi:hypothetical protein
MCRYPVFQQFVGRHRPVVCGNSKINLSTGAPDTSTASVVELNRGAFGATPGRCSLGGIRMNISIRIRSVIALFFVIAL